MTASISSVNIALTKNNIDKPTIEKTLNLDTLKLNRLNTDKRRSAPLLTSPPTKLGEPDINSKENTIKYDILLVN